MSDEKKIDPPPEPPDEPNIKLGREIRAIHFKAGRDFVISESQGSGLRWLDGLVEQVERLVQESGDPEDFNARKWVAAWLERPQPALDGHRPAEFMDSAAGRQIVSDLVARMQSGAYS